MKIVIFGATGSVGQQLLDQALARGHNVSAFTRNPAKIKKKHQNLTIMEGDILNVPAVRFAVRGQDAVFCTLGMPLMNNEGLRAKGTKNIIRAMESLGVKRFICLSGLGAGDSWNVLPFHYKYLIFPLLMRRVYADHERQEGHIKNSQSDWTIVRPGNFTDGPHTQSYRHGFTKPDASLKLSVSRADVADFMVKQLTDDSYLHKAASVSY